MSWYHHDRHCLSEDNDGCSANCTYELWAPSNRGEMYNDNFTYSNYANSLHNIAVELSENPHADQEEVCQRWGRSLDDLTQDEIRFIEQTIEELY